MLHKLYAPLLMGVLIQSLTGCIPFQGEISGAMLEVFHPSAAAEWRELERQTLINSQKAAPVPQVIPAAPVVTVAENQLMGGAQMEVLTPLVAQALGLNTESGVLVSEVAENSKAEKAGLKSMDIIVEISGQSMNSPTDVVVIASRLRTDYLAPVRVWRNKTTLDLKLDLASLSGNNQPAVVTLPSTTLLQPVVQSTNTELPSPIATGGIQKYCFVNMFSQLGITTKITRVLSNTWENVDSDGSETSIKNSLITYVAQVNRAQRNKWRNLDQINCSKHPTYTFCNALINGQFRTVDFQCHDTYQAANELLSIQKSRHPKAILIPWQTFDLQKLFK